GVAVLWEVGLVRGFEGGNAGVRGARAVALHECIDEVAIVGVVQGRSVRVIVGPRPARRDIDTGEDLETRGGGSLDNAIRLAPVELALLRLPLRPGDARLLPRETRRAGNLGTRRPRRGGVP